MSEKIQIILNSKTAHQYLNSQTTDCIFQIPLIELKKHHRASISVTNAIIPYGWYNVNSTNNQLNYVLNDISYNITIPEANYNITSLIAILHGLLEEGFTITYSAPMNKVTIEHNLYEWHFNTGTTCQELLGIVTVPNTNNSTYTSEIALNLFTVRTLQISSSNFITNNINSNQPNRASIITSIPVNSNMGSIINYNNINNVSSVIHNINNLSNLHIQILDQDGDILELNGLHWSINLLLSID